MMCTEDGEPSGSPGPGACCASLEDTPPSFLVSGLTAPKRTRKKREAQAVWLPWPLWGPRPQELLGPLTSKETGTRRVSPALTVSESFVLESTRNLGQTGTHKMACHTHTLTHTHTHRLLQLGLTPRSPTGRGKGRLGQSDCCGSAMGWVPQEDTPGPGHTQAGEGQEERPGLGRDEKVAKSPALPSC